MSIKYDYACVCVCFFYQEKKTVEILFCLTSCFRCTFSKSFWLYKIQLLKHLDTYIIDIILFIEDTIISA